MNKSLADLSVKLYGSHIVKLPVPITREDRNRKLSCPLTKDVMKSKVQGQAPTETFRNVSLYTCMKCVHLQLRSKAGVELTRSCGFCVYPKKASKESRAITQGWKADNDLSEDGTVKLTKKAIRSKREAKPGGYKDKVGRIAQLIKAGYEKDSVEKGMRKKFPDIKQTTFNTMWYAGKKLVRENQVPELKIVFPDPPAQAHILLAKELTSPARPHVILNSATSILDCPDELLIKYQKALDITEPNKLELLISRFIEKFGARVMDNISNPRRVLLDLQGKVLVTSLPGHQEAIQEWFKDYDEDIQILQIPTDQTKLDLFFETFEWLEIKMSDSERRQIKSEKKTARRAAIAKELGITLR